MGMFNYLAFNSICPRCQKEMKMFAEFKFGYLNMDIYHVGEKIVHTINDAECRGIFIEKGYVECDNCHKDFWVDIIIEDGMIRDIHICNKMKGYIK